MKKYINNWWIYHIDIAAGEGGLVLPLFFAKLDITVARIFLISLAPPSPFSILFLTPLYHEKNIVDHEKNSYGYIFIFFLCCCFYYSAICYDVWRWMEQIWMVTPVWNSALSWSKGRFAWKADDWELVFLHHVFNILFHVLIMKKLYFEQEFLPLLST